MRDSGSFNLNLPNYDYNKRVKPARSTTVYGRLLEAITDRHFFWFKEQSYE